MKLTTSIAKIVLILSSLSTIPAAAQTEVKSDLLVINDTLHQHEIRITHLERLAKNQSLLSQNTVPANNEISKKLSVSISPRVSSSYTVKKGDHAGSIAKHLGVSTSDLLKVNKLKSTSILRIGQRLTIPGGKVAANEGSASTNSAKVSTVTSAKTGVKLAKEDTLYKLAKRYNTTVEAIKAANPGIRENALRPGSTIMIPGKASTVTKTTTNQEPTKKITNKVDLTVPALGEMAKDLHSSAPKQVKHVEEPKAEYLNHSPLQVAGMQEYETRANDTWESVAETFGTTAQSLRQQNGAVAGRDLTPGTFLKVPNPY